MQRVKGRRRRSRSPDRDVRDMVLQQSAHTLHEEHWREGGSEPVPGPKPS